MKAVWILVGAAAMLAGCGKPSVDERNASAEDVAKAVAKSGGAGLKFTPGRWESKVKFLEMSAPGMPAEAAQAMNRMVGKERSDATCLSKEAADKPAGEFFANNAENCRYEHFTMGGGKIDARMRCSEGKGEAVVAMNGRYGPTHYAMTMETSVATSAAGPMTMRMAIEANHAGACRGDEKGRS